MIYKGLDEFNAADEQILQKFKALYLLNCMRNLGYNTRKKFVDTCLTYISLEINSITINKVQSFWDGRDITLISEMEKIIEQLKSLKNE